ncbi:MAG: dihydrolipoyl dehydrogenase family protein [Geminicoccaceae bacterium]
MERTFDLVVVGTGVAASTVAGRCRAAGWSVAIVDELPYGGTCQLRGCDPKKVLRRGAEVVDAARLMHGRGIADPGPRIDWPSLMAFKRSFTEPVPANKEQAFAASGIATYHGTARFVAEDALAVGGERLLARHVVIASGAEPVPLPILGAEHVTMSDAFLELEALPPRVLFIGGGYVSFEFAHIAARADARVIVLDRGERPLMGFDPDLVAKLLERTRALGIDFRAKAAVEAIARAGAGLRVAATIDGRSETFEADLVVHGAGRAPALARLDLERGNVRAEKKGVAVNDFLQSVSNPRVYAAGDAAATAGPPLTPVASLEAEVVATNLLDGNAATPDYTGVPSVVFTIPELARVGIDEAEAREEGQEVEIKATDMSDWYSVARVGETHAAAKVLIEKDTARILGAHLLGPEASELINFFGLAMRTGLTATDLKKLVSAYPSAASDLGHLI